MMEMIDQYKKKQIVIFQGPVVELVIKLIIWLALITFFIPNHTIS